jgi:hypothetical protein
MRNFVYRNITEGFILLGVCLKTYVSLKLSRSIAYNNAIYNQRLLPLAYS